MPYRSDAQRRFFHAAESRGDISKKTVNEFDKESKGMNLPEKVKHKMAHGGFAKGILKAKEMAKRKKMWVGGDIDDDVGYYKNSSGEPHTNDKLTSEHPMEYMADGGDVGDAGKKLQDYANAHPNEQAHPFSFPGQEPKKMFSGGGVGESNYDPTWAEDEEDPDMDQDGGMIGESNYHPSQAGYQAMAKGGHVHKILKMADGGGLPLSGPGVSVEDPGDDAFGLKGMASKKKPGGSKPSGGSDVEATDSGAAAGATDLVPEAAVALVYRGGRIEDDNEESNYALGEKHYSSDIEDQDEEEDANLAYGGRVKKYAHGGKAGFAAHLKKKMMGY